MKKQPILVSAIIFITIGIIIFLAVVGSRGGDVATKRDINSVTVQKDGSTLTVSRDGTVRYETDSGVFTGLWDAEKTNTFFDYIDSSYGGAGEVVTGGGNYITVSSSSGTTVYVLGEDELIDAVEEETSGGGGGSTSPTATPGQGGSGGGSGGGGGGGPDPECLYWRLSYCVRPRTPSPTPSSTPAPVEIREPNCDANTQTGRTVIGNDLCLPTPSPTP